MNRRAFLKIALVTSGVAIGGYFGPQLLDMVNTSVQSLENQMQFGATTFTTDDWKIPHLLRRTGFGASPTELAYFENLGVNEATDQLLNYENIDVSNLPDIEAGSASRLFKFEANDRLPANWRL